MANLKKRIAAAKESHVADEQAAQKAEGIATPAQAEQEKTRAAWQAAREVANNKREAADKAKAVLYRLFAARQVEDLMESPERAEPANGMDTIIFTKLKSLGIEPALCSDAVFVRRVFLDVTGTLPSADEAKRFIRDPAPDKRSRLVDDLLGREAFADYQAMRWADLLRVKAEFPINLWPNAVQAYHHWIHTSIRENMPYDRFVREMLTGSGSNFRYPQVNFYRAVQSREPQAIAQAVALSFMGVRPESWPQERWSGMALPWASFLILRVFSRWEARSGRRPPSSFPGGTCRPTR